MKKLFTLALGSTALAGVTMTTPAQAADFEPVPTYTWAATVFFGGGGSWLDRSFSGNLPRPIRCRRGVSCNEFEIAHIVGGGDFVIPLDGVWNVQLGGAFHTDHEHRFGRSSSRTQFQGSAIGFWRDPTTGVFGIEAGLYSPIEGFQNSFKVGGVAQYFFGDMVTFGAFGGALVPTEQPFSRKSFDTGFYAGGDVTFYASETLAFAGFARFTELGNSFRPRRIEDTDQSLNVGGKVRYLTSMPGVELYASGSYRKCESEESRGSRRGTFTLDGAQFMGGINIRLGGLTDSLVAIDRSNAIDTRAWHCSGGGIGVM